MWHWQLLNFFKVTKSVWKKYSLTDATIMQLKISHLINIIFNTDSEKHQYYLVMLLKIGRWFGPPKKVNGLGRPKLGQERNFYQWAKHASTKNESQASVSQEFSKLKASYTNYHTPGPLWPCISATFFPLPNFLILKKILLWKWNSSIKSSWCASHRTLLELAYAPATELWWN